MGVGKINYLYETDRVRKEGLRRTHTLLQERLANHDCLTGNIPSEENAPGQKMTRHSFPGKKLQTYSQTKMKTGTTTSTVKRPQMYMFTIDDRIRIGAFADIACLVIGDPAHYRQ